MDTTTRTNSFGEHHKLTFVDRFGVWLSSRRILKIIKKNNVNSVGDFGCGYDAIFSQSIRTKIDRCVLVDVGLSEELIRAKQYETHVGHLPSVLSNVTPESLDLVIMNSVLEHLDQPIEVLEKIQSLLVPNGIVFINVPTWFGKRILELLAFKLHLSPAEEMEDHRRYYRRSDLWLSLRKSGFLPSKIKIRHHKFGTNVYAIARKD